MKKTIILASLLVGMPSFAGTPILTCDLGGTKPVRFDLSPLEQEGACRTGVVQTSSPLVRYELQFCVTDWTASGFVEIRNDAGVWIRGAGFSTEKPYQNCELSRSIEVGCPDGRMDLCPNPGGHQGLTGITLF